MLQRLQEGFSCSNYAMTQQLLEVDKLFLTSSALKDLYCRILRTTEVPKYPKPRFVVMVKSTWQCNHDHKASQG